MRFEIKLTIVEVKTKWKTVGFRIIEHISIGIMNPLIRASRPEAGTQIGRAQSWWSPVIGVDRNTRGSDEVRNTG